MTAVYTVVLAARAAKTVEKLPRDAQRAVVRALESLAVDPRAGKPLTGPLAGLWSLRRGDHRIVYLIDDRQRRVSVARVAHRRDVYRSD